MTPESLKRIKNFLIQEMIANDVEAEAWHELFVMAAMNQDLETIQQVIDAPSTKLTSEDRQVMQTTAKLISSVQSLAERLNNSPELTDDEIRQDIERTLQQVQAELGESVTVHDSSSIEQQAQAATSALLARHMLH
jgi:methyltransferase-like protein